MGKQFALRAILGAVTLALAGAAFASEKPASIHPGVDSFKQLVACDQLSLFEAQWRTFVAELAAGKIKAVVPAANTTRWKMDRVTLKPPPSRSKSSRSQVLEGLILSQDAEFVQIMVVSRRPGKDLSARVPPPIPRDKIQKLSLLNDEERASLNQSLIQHFSRHELAKAAEALIKLEFDQDRLGRRWWIYSGPSFDMFSTLDESTTREAIHRLEQRMKAFHDFFPPRHEPQKKLSIRLLSKPREYEQYLAQLGLRVKAQALFDVAGNQVIGYYDGVALKAALAKSRQHHDALLQQLEAMELRHKKQRKIDAEDLDRKGASADEIRKFILLRENKFKDKVEQIRQKISAAERRNQEMYDKLSSQMYRALYHEAFHAYMENRLFNHREHQVPRWLNEGLAQVFESGLIDGGTLRIDVPDPERLQWLSAALKDGGGMTLMELFSAGPDAYLADHNRDAAERKPHYLYAWGLTYYLLTQRHLAGNRLTEFVRPPKP